MIIRLHADRVVTEELEKRRRQGGRGKGREDKKKKRIATDCTSILSLSNTGFHHWWVSVIESKCIVPEGTWKEAITLMQLIRRLTESSLPPSPTYAVLNDPTPPRAIIIFHSPVSPGIPENPDEETNEFNEFHLFHAFQEQNRAVPILYIFLFSFYFASLFLQ